MLPTVPAPANSHALCIQSATCFPSHLLALLRTIYLSMRFHFPRLPAWGLPTPGRRFSDTTAFDQAVGAVFSKVAVNGVVDDMALVVAMCELHFRLKKHVPGVTRTPTREAVREVLVGFDANRDGVLDEAEFRRFAKQVSARRRRPGMSSGKTCGEECMEEGRR